jgi:hypothetical protein
MSRFGKEKEDQLAYANAKLEKANYALRDQIENELLPKIREQEVDYDILTRALVLALFELGGSIEASDADFDAVNARIKVEHENESFTFSISTITEEEPSDAEAV